MNPAGDSDAELASWRLVAETLPAMVFTASPNGAIEFVNRRWSEFTGFPAEVALGDRWASLIHPDDLDRTSAAWSKALTSCESFELEMRVRKADGSYAWLHSSAAPLRAPSGRIQRWIGTCVDIDTRRRAEESVREQEALLVDSARRFQALGEALPVICWTADAEGWIDWYNRRWYEYTGQSEREARGWGWQAAHHPDDFLEVMRKWPDSIATGQGFEMEFRLRRHDGVFHWFLTRAEPFRDENGSVVRWYGSNVDIDAQKRALERSKRIAETMQDVFLPKSLPQKAGLRFDAIYLPAEKDALVGGDWFDAFELPDGRTVFSIGDVAGHGLEASITVGRVRQAIYTLALRLDNPADILKEADRILRYQEPETMVTAIVGSIDASLRRLTYASAGHPPPLVASRRGEPARSLRYGDPPLGVGEPRDFTLRELEIEPDMVVALFTDGMVEFGRNIEAAEEKLKSAVGLLVGNTKLPRPARAVQELVFNDEPSTDDAALMILQFSEANVEMFAQDPGDLEKTWRFHSSDPYSAHHSRREIVAHLRRVGAEDEGLFVAELIIGEILANTVEHAPGLVEVELDWRGEKPLVSVRDAGSGALRVSGDLPDDPLAEDGRGIFLAKTLAEHFSLRHLPGYGTEVTARLPLLRRAPPVTPQEN
ncbi:MAG: PAS domain-containing protein [Candidatus Eremiobacteraeota bacterium]|nr:PAS domain-containing protein [Candidatus Eremiobacteraeota bacterium]